MATKKVAPKKAAKPATKAPAKPAAKSNSKAVAAKKTAPAPKKVSKPAPAPAKAVKKAAVPAAKPVAKPPAKPAPKPAVVAKKAATPAATKQRPAPAPAPKAVVQPVTAPVKKPSVVGTTTQTAKTATKPLEAKATVPATPAKEAAKPVKEPAKPARLVIPKTSTDKKIKYEPDFTRSVLDSQKQAANGPTMRYSDAELAEFRDLINRKLDVAKKELAYLQGLITRKDESGDLDEGRYMTMEDGSMSMEREQLSQMASRQIQFIDHLEKAIMRIENKTYGVCRVTGKLIDKARLRAVPHATLSIEAKQMMNK